MDRKYDLTSDYSLFSRTFYTFAAERKRIMANVIEIQSLHEPGVEIFGTLTEAQLRNRIDAERGIFIAESPKVIRVAMRAKTYRGRCC